MATQKGNVGPPRLLRFAVESLIPRESREDTAGDWNERYISLWQYLGTAARSLPVIVAGQARRAFDCTLRIGEVCILCVAFGGAPAGPLFVLLIAAVLVLVLRDGYIHPARATAREVATDVMILGFF